MFYLAVVHKLPQARQRNPGGLRLPGCFKGFSDTCLSHPSPLLSPSIVESVPFGSGEFVTAAFKTLFAKFSKLKTKKS